MTRYRRTALLAVALGLVGCTKPEESSRVMDRRVVDAAVREEPTPTPTPTEPTGRILVAGNIQGDFVAKCRVCRAISTYAPREVRPWNVDGNRWYARCREPLCDTMVHPVMLDSEAGRALVAEAKR